VATSSAPPLARKTGVPLSKETRITVLTALKNFYDEQIFALLVKDFYNSDLEVSLAAIGASASLGNEVAIPHLYRMLESGKPQQKLAAVQTLAAINAPSSIDQLAKYFNLLTATEIRREILRAINKISALHPTARELNRAVLVDPASAREYYEISLSGLLESGDLDQVRAHLLRAPPEVQRAVFQRLLSAGSLEAGGFLEYFQDKIGQLDPNTLGCYLCALELKTANPPANFVVDALSGSDRRATTSFLISLGNYNGSISNPGRLFRLLLRLPYVDQEAETHTGNFITRIVAEIRSHSPLLVNEFVFTTSANLEAVFAKAKKQHISLKGLKEREDLLAVILAKLLEQYASAELLADTLSHFKGDGGINPASLIARIREALIAAPEDERNRFEACLPLFTTGDRLVRVNVAHTLGRANRTSPALLRRLNRLIRVAGILEAKASARKIMEILTFAREERVSFLEESSVVTLCQLLSRPAIEQAKVVFASPARYPHSLSGYVRGARYVPARIFASGLLRLMLQPELPPRLRDLAIDSLKNMDLAEIKGLAAGLIRVAGRPGLDRARLNDLAGIIARYGDSAILQPLIELTGSSDLQQVELGIRSLRSLAQREHSLPLDVLTHRLYLLLEHKQKSLRVEALLTLLALHDDYATQILEDYLHSEDSEAIVQILAHLERPLTRETVNFLLKLLAKPNAEVHRELRRILPELCQGSGAEELRVALLGAFKGQQGASGPIPAAAPAPDAGLIEQAKLDFKFRRENAQVLTVLFTDMVGFTATTERTAASSLIKLLGSYEDIALPAIEQLHGRLVKKLGDGLLATFKHPLNAAVASLQIQKKIQEYNQFRTDAEKFNVRIGLNTGMVIRKGGDVFGDTVNVAARMQSSASPGEIRLTQSTYEEIKDYVRCTHLGALELKGKAEPVTAYSADEVLIDVNRLLTDGREAQGPTQGTRPTGQLKESMFEPDFRVPDGQARPALDGRQLASLQGLFRDFARAAEDLSKDYHEEYEFKSYLQKKWLELLGSSSAPPQ
jgi:class 3 adenylate cyclase/HEAT repeat protein